MALIPPSPAARSRSPSVVGSSNVMLPLTAEQKNINSQVEDKYNAMVKKEKDGVETKKKYLFPIFATVLCLNFALWISLMFQIFNIEMSTSNYVEYELISWLFLFGILAIVSVGLLWLPISRLGHIRDYLACWEPHNSRWIHLSVLSRLNIANALLCFFFVLLYMCQNAYPKYHTPQWKTGSNYSANLAPPAFAFIGGYNDAAMATFQGSFTKCTFPEAGYQCSDLAFSNSLAAVSTNSSVYGNLNAYIFRPQSLEGTLGMMTALSDRVLLQIPVYYNLTELQLVYEERAPQTPYLFAAIFDSRLDDLGKALDCGLIALTEIPALASNTFTLTTTHVSDSEHMIIPASGSPCSAFYSNALSQDDPPYTSYAFHISSSIIADTSLCDISFTPNAACVSQVLLRFGSHILTTMESEPGLEKVEIILNAGAIVGAVQFAFWLLGNLA